MYSSTLAIIINSMSIELPEWYKKWNATGYIAWADFNGDGKIAFTNNTTDTPAEASSWAAMRPESPAPTMVT